MSICSRLIEKLLSDLHGDKIDQGTRFRIMDQIKRAEEIRRSLDSLCQARSELQRSYWEASKQLDLKEGDIKASCLHQLSTFHYDPSGGSDSHTTCDICGETL